jgi:hypothetical protein
MADWQEKRRLEAEYGPAIKPMMVKTSIPDNHVEFCRDIARLCRKHGVQKFHGSYRPNFDDPWDGEIIMAWEQGRHGEDSDRLYVNSRVDVYTRLGPPKDRY